MALPFKNIGKRIDDFLKAKEYNLKRTAKLNVNSDKVNWSLKNELNSEGVDSELSVEHQFEKDTLKLTARTDKAPEFEIRTKRFKSRFGLKASIRDPKLELKLNQKREKYHINLDSSYDWSNQNCDATLAVAYDVNDKLRLGTKAKVERSQKPALAVSDYNVAVQYQQNKDRTFAITTSDRLQKVNVGAEFKVRDKYQGFAQVSYKFNAGGDDNTNPLGYSVGIRKCMNDSANLRAVYRDNMTASVMYSNNFTNQNICAKIAANFDLTKQPSEGRTSVEWKIIFNSGKKGPCCGGKK